MLAALVVLVLASLTNGSYRLSLGQVFASLGLAAGGPADIVVWNLRLPRIISAIVAGWGLAVAGTTMQCLIRNRLGSPFTLGISHGAAFGAAFAIVVLGAGGALIGPPQAGAADRIAMADLYLTSLAAFAGAMGTTVVVLLIARLKSMAPEAIILAGVALSSLFMSGTIVIQYLATESEVAAVVFWTFGDVARAGWPAILVMSVATLLGSVYFASQAFTYNALSAGDEAALGLGVNVNRVRLVGMAVAALVSALAVAFLGVIAFLGLLAPHIARRLVGADHRQLMLHSGMVGSLLLLAADTVGRLFIGSGSLPVGVLTSFLGAPLFLYLLLSGRRR
jgi:iron complex transport system permease protein